MLEGRNVSLKIVEKDDIPTLAEWVNTRAFTGEFNPLKQMPRAELEKILEKPEEFKPFFIEKKDGSKIGFIVCFNVSHPGVGAKLLEIGYSLAPSERGKGYCTEAVNIMVDYLFLSKENVRIQAQTDVRNVASQRVLEKVGFKKEGTLRKNFFIQGEWRDVLLYSILREEWKSPRILTA